MAQHARYFLGNILFGKNIRADSVVNIVIKISDNVGEAHYYALFRFGKLVRVFQYAVAHLVSKVQAIAVIFYQLDHAHALLVVLKAVGIYAVERTLARVAEGRVPQIVPHGYSFGKVFIQPHSPRDGSRYLPYLKRVGKAGAVVVAGGAEKDLRFQLQPSE